MPYNPLDASFATSSILTHGPDVGIVFCLLIATADRDGISDLTVPHIANVLRISEERVDKAFDVLTSPDARSRNQAEEGRRILPAARGGWFLVSHARYRARQSKELAAARQARFMERKKARKAEDGAHR